MCLGTEWETKFAHAGFKGFTYSPAVNEMVRLNEANRYELRRKFDYNNAGID